MDTCTRIRRCREAIRWNRAELKILQHQAVAELNKYVQDLQQEYPDMLRKLDEGGPEAEEINRKIATKVREMADRAGAPSEALFGNEPLDA